MLTVLRFTRNDFIGLFLSAVCVLGSPTVRANIIDSTYGAGAGSFELGNFVNNGINFMSLAPSATAITGWTVGGPGGGIDWLTTLGWGADTGSKSVDLQLNGSSSISTTIPTITGTVYSLSFGAAANTAYITNTGVVSAGSLVNQAFTAALSNNFSNQSFIPFTFLFNATGSTTTITFQGTGPDTQYGPVIDSVSVSAVPVPAAVWLFGSALPGFVGFGRRKPGKAQS